MSQVAVESVSQPRFSASLLGLFAAVALLLATVGIYGLVSYSVQQRTQEIGVRIALGARGLDVIRLEAGRGMLYALSGIAVGLAGVLALTRVISSLLFETSPTDPVTLGGTALLLLATVAAACLIPARRAARVEPSRALRCE
jgi:putative ABC transport system permease protein